MKSIFTLLALQLLLILFSFSPATSQTGQAQPLTQLGWITGSNPQFQARRALGVDFQFRDCAIGWNWQATSALRIRLAELADVTIRVVDLQGSVVSTMNLGYLSTHESDHHISSAQLASGVYILEVTAAGHVEHVRFVVK